MLVSRKYLFQRDPLRWLKLLFPFPVNSRPKLAAKRFGGSDGNIRDFGKGSDGSHRASYHGSSTSPNPAVIHVNVKVQ